MPEESREGCRCSKPDLKKEAQRTNRFNTNSSPNSASSCLTTYDHLETTKGVANDYKSQEKDDIPCINIILKPILDPKTDEKDKNIQIVEITAITDDSNKHSTNNTNTSVPDQYQSATKETENIEMKNVMIQTEVEKNMRHYSTQTTGASTDQICSGASLIKQIIPEVTMENSTASQQAADADLSKRNKGVQFKDDKTVVDNVSNLSQSLSTGVESNTRSSSKNNPLCDRNSTGIFNIDSSTTMGIIDNQCVRTKGHETSVPSIECINSMETLYKLINSEDKSNRPSEFKSCIKKTGQGPQGKLSDRIKRNIDKLEIGSCVSTQSSAHDMNTSHGTQQESVKTQTSISSCIDICKDIASQTKMLNSYSDKSNSSLATRNSSTLPSVLSNNPPIPRFSIDTTDTMEWKSPASMDNTSCCSNQKLNIDGKSCKIRNVTTDQDYSNNISHEQQYPDNNRITVSGNIEENSDMTKEKVEKIDNGTATREFWANEDRNISKLGIDRDSSVRTKSINTSNEAKTLESTGSLPLINNNELTNEETLNARNCCKSIAIQTNSVNFSHTPEYSSITNTNLGDKPDFLLSTPNTRNFLTASDLTRPEFIRMLTELKEHTCSLELQLAAMNEAMKRKQASRSKVFNSTLKNYQPTRQDHLAYKSETKKITTTNESSYCTSDFPSIEHARQTPEEFDVENSIDTFCCAPSDDNSLSKDRHPGCETLIDETCYRGTMISEPNESYTPLRLRKKLKTSSHTVPSTEPEQIIIVQDNSNISISKEIPKKPVFKTKRSYLWAPRLSDYRIREQNEDKLTPSGKSMDEPEVSSQSVTPNSLMVKTKVDVSCSPTNCCNAHEDSLETMFKAGRLSPISKLEESDVIVRSATYSTTSNPLGNRMTVRPSFLSSTLRRSSSNKYREVTESAKVSSCDLDTSKYSNVGKRCSQSGKMEQNLGTMKQNEEHVQISPLKSKIPKVRPRLGIKQSSSKFRTKGRAKSIPSNSYLHSSASRGSLRESSSQNSSKNRKTQRDATKPPPLHSKELGVVPQLKLKSIRSRNPSNSYIEKNSSQAYLDPACCSGANENGEITSELNNSLHSNRHQSMPSEKVHTKAVDQNQGKDHFAYTIKTEQNSPFLVNNFVKYDSEEEVSSTDYGFNKSVMEPCGKESKDNANGKKRKRNSGIEKFIKMEEKSGLMSSNTPEVSNRQNNSQSSQYQEHSGYNSKSKNNSESTSSNHHSVKIQEFNNVSGKSNHTNSQEKDSKCTIRVTVSLDNTTSNEEVKNI